jgi:hypothetical protein
MLQLTNRHLLFFSIFSLSSVLPVFVLAMATTAIEALFNQFIDRGNIESIFVSDLHGQLIVESPQAPSEELMETQAAVTNAVSAGGAVFKQLAELRLHGVNFICVKFNQRMCVQFADSPVLTTIVALNSQNAVGGLIAMVPQIRSHQAYKDMVTVVRTSLEEFS